MEVIPETQHAVQLTGPNELCLNTRKPLPRPKNYEVLGRVEATGLCFSDLKLLKQYSEHARKGRVIAGMDEAEFLDNPSYVPDDQPTVPGHETVLRIIAIGDKVQRHTVGERCLVQTDYRKLLTTNGSNASFGYNFEGGLQEYVIVDERIARDFDTNERFLIPVTENKSASAICLVEPWACVEDSYANVERQTLKAGGKLLVVADSGHTIEGLAQSFSPDGAPGSITACCANIGQTEQLEVLFAGVPLVPCPQPVEAVSALPDEYFDDIVYYGVTKEIIEALSSKLAPGAIINIVQGGRKIGQPVAIGIGRIHYGMMRWVGTTGTNAADGYTMIPETGEIRDNERISVPGAGGPMGQMHVIRNICMGKKNVEIVATDFDDQRLKSLERLVGKMAAERGVKLQVQNPQTNPPTGKFSYAAIMVPIPQLVAQAIAQSSEGCIINIFAGIPAPTVAEIDLDTMIAHRCFMLGTSGSVLRDMKAVLAKVEGDLLDTNCSVDAVSGMVGAIDGIRAVENRTLAGKIIVYPVLHDLPLLSLVELAEKYPTVAEKLDNGLWTKAAEGELLRVAR